MFLLLLHIIYCLSFVLTLVKPNPKKWKSIHFADYIFRNAISFCKGNNQVINGFSRLIDQNVWLAGVCFSYSTQFSDVLTYDLPCINFIGLYFFKSYTVYMTVYGWSMQYIVIEFYYFMTITSCTFREVVKCSLES